MLGRTDSEPKQRVVAQLLRDAEGKLQQISSNPGGPIQHRLAVAWPLLADVLSQPVSFDLNLLGNVPKLSGDLGGRLRQVVHFRHGHLQKRKDRAGRFAIPCSGPAFGSARLQNFVSKPSRKITVNAAINPHSVAVKPSSFVRSRPKFPNIPAPNYRFVRGKPKADYGWYG
jgi:hypothetical protein